MEFELPVKIYTGDAYAVSQRKASIQGLRVPAHEETILTALQGSAQDMILALVSGKKAPPATTVLVDIDDFKPSKAFLEALKTTRGVFCGFGKPASALAKIAEVFDEPSIPPWKVCGWVQEKAKQLGLTMSGQLAEMLVRLVGTDRFLLDSELSKLELLAPGSVVTPELMRAVVTPSKMIESWDLVEAFFQKQQKKLALMFSVLFQYTSSDDKVLPILGALVKGLELRLLYHEYTRRGLDETDIQLALGLTQFQYRDIAATAKSWSTSQLVGVYQQCASAHALFLRGAAEPRTILEKVFFCTYERPL